MTKLRRLALVQVFATLAGFGATAQAQWSGSFSDMGVNYTLSDTTIGISTTHTYSLVLNTIGYNHTAAPAYLDSVDIKAWGGSATSFLLLSAPGGVSGWGGTEGPISSGPVGNTGCQGNDAGFACVEANSKGVFSVLSGNPYSFSFSVTLSDASSFLNSAGGVHVGAGYANANGAGAGFGITSYTMATPIPEPESYAMLLAGLGFLSFALRRRNQRQRAAA